MTHDPDEAILPARMLRHQLHVTGNLIGLTLVYHRENSVILKNATLEAANSRMRLLIEFIAGRGNKSRQQNERDFQPADLGVLDWCARNVPRLRTDLKDLDQRSAHLSKVRAENLDGFPWSPDSAYPLILEEFSTFADAVDGTGNSVAAEILRDGVRGAYYLMENPTHVYPFNFNNLDAT